MGVGVIDSGIGTSDVFDSAEYADHSSMQAWCLLAHVDSDIESRAACQMPMALLMRIRM